MLKMYDWNLCRKDQKRMKIRHQTVRNWCSVKRVHSLKESVKQYLIILSFFAFVSIVFFGSSRDWWDISISGSVNSEKTSRTWSWKTSIAYQELLNARRLAIESTVCTYTQHPRRKREGGGRSLGGVKEWRGWLYERERETDLYQY